ncbi:MAG: DUF1499 domain-containing protein [Rhodobacterales bacterium]|nr:DUF1499 domain-containing protein [Rhodobacterales bacterium]
MAISRINDISTDLEDVPELSWRMADSGHQNSLPSGFKALIRQSYADLVPLILPVAPDVAYQRAHRLALHWPRWTMVRADADAGVLEGYETTRLFRFKDDFVIRFRAEGDGARIDMRSKSRLGKSDLGVNAKRIRAFFEVLRSVDDVHPR